MPFTENQDMIQTVARKSGGGDPPAWRLWTARLKAKVGETAWLGRSHRRGHRARVLLGVASSDWDGSGGWPMPQLWNTHTHNVKLNGSVSSVRYQASGDCLVPVAFVIDAD